MYYCQFPATITFAKIQQNTAKVFFPSSAFINSFLEKDESRNN